MKVLTLLLIGLFASLTLTIQAINDAKIKELQRKIQLLEERGNALDTLGAYYHDLGKAYFRYGKYGMAIQSTLKARAARRAMAQIDYLTLGHSCLNLGVFYEKSQHVHKLDSAIFYYREAVEAYEAINHSKLIKASRSLATVLGSKGVYRQAIIYLEDAAQRGRVLQEYIQLGKVLNQLSIIYKETEDYQKGIEVSKEAIACYNKFPVEQYQLERANTYNSLASNYQGLDQYNLALVNYLKAFEISSAIEDQERMFLFLHNIGVCYKRLGEYDLALQAFAESMKIGEGSLTLVDLADFYNNTADIYLSQGDFDRALDFYFRSIAIVLPGLSKDASFDDIQEDMLQNASHKTTLVIRVTNYGQAYHRYYLHTQNRTYLEKALQIYEQADHIMDFMRQEHSMDASKYFWRKKARSIYEAALEICYALDDHDRAFYFLEKSKSILLLDAMQEDHARATIPAEALAEEKKLQEAVELAARNLENKVQQNAEDVAQYRAALLSEQRQLEDFISKLEDQYPQYVNLKYKTEVIALAKAQVELLKSGSAMLSYFYGKQNVYLFKLNKKGRSQFLKIEKTKDLEDKIVAFAKLFKDDLARRSPPFEDYKRLAYQLFDQLIAPVFDPKEEEVIIIPDGPLSFIPFEALLTNRAGERFQSLNYLIRKQRIRQAYSASVLQMQEGAVRNQYVSLHVAPGFEDQPGMATLVDMNTSSLENLGHFRLQAGVNATLEAFRKQASTSNIINLFTHAEAINGLPPKIEFADTCLYLSQLYTMDIPADLVVLGACETSIGKMEEGEGVMSLARGFAYAGARSLVASLWRVNDHHTATLLEDFYANLGNGQSKAEALHNAKLAFLENGAKVRPAHWAGLVFIGNDARLSRNKDWGRILLMIGAGLGLMLALRTLRRGSITKWADQY